MKQRTRDEIVRIVYALRCGEITKQEAVDRLLRVFNIVGEK